MGERSQSIPSLWVSGRDPQPFGGLRTGTPKKDATKKGIVVKKWMRKGKLPTITKNYRAW